MVEAIRCNRYMVVLGLVLACVAALFALNSSQSEASERCQAAGSSLSSAKAAYSQNCRAPRIDCDPLGGRWVCSSEQIGSNSPGGDKRSSVKANQPQQPSASSPGLSVEQQQEIFVSVLTQMAPEQQQDFVARLQEISAAEREQVAQSILEQQQSSAPVQRTAAPAQSAPAQSSQPTSGLSVEQQQEIFVSVLTQMAPEQQQDFVARLQELSAAEREQVAQSILEQQSSQQDQARSAPAAEPAPERSVPTAPAAAEPASARTQYKTLGIAVPTKSPGGQSWADSYSYQNRCYVASSFDHGAGDLSLNGVSARQIQASQNGPGIGRADAIYNDINCGNGPANNAGDENWCPGRVDMGARGCVIAGPDIRNQR